MKELIGFKANVIKEIFVHEGNHFSVEIVHFKKYGENKFNVYANVFPDHPLFDSLGEGIFKCEDMPFNYCATYVNWYRDKDGKVYNKKYGSDYGHIHDNVEHVESIHDMPRIVDDANELIEYLNDKEVTNA